MGRGIKMLLAIFMVISAFIGVRSDIGADNHQDILKLTSRTHRTELRLDMVDERTEGLKNTTSTLSISLKNINMKQEEQEGKMDKLKTDVKEMKGDVDVMDAELREEIKDLQEKLEKEKESAAADVKALEDKISKQIEADEKKANALEEKMTKQMKADEEKVKLLEEKIAKQMEADEKKVKALEEKMMSITQKLGEELSTERKNAKSLEEKMLNITNIFEERFSKKEEQVKEMKQKMSTHEGRINEMSDQESDLKKKMTFIISVLPKNFTLNTTEDFGEDIKKLNQKVDMFQIDMQKNVNEVMDQVTKIETEDIEAMKNTTLDITHEVDELKKGIIKFGQDIEKSKQDLLKYIPSVSGFRYTGPGWSYGHQEISKYNMKLDECLKFCAMKKKMNKSINGVNYIMPTAYSTTCYCISGSYGFNARKDAMQFLAA